MLTNPRIEEGKGERGGRQIQKWTNSGKEVEGGGKEGSNKLTGGRKAGRREGGSEVTTLEGKEGDKVKECSETTGPLFPLKELPHHSALLGGLHIQQGGSYTTWPANSSSLDPSRLLLVWTTLLFYKEIMSVVCFAQEFRKMFLSKSLQQTMQQRLNAAHT